MTVAFRSVAGNGSTSATSVSVTKPTGTVSGDILIATIVGVNTDGNDWGISGFTELWKETAPGSLFWRVLYKVAGGSEPSSYSVAKTGTADRVSCGIAAYSGAASTLDVSGHQANVGSSTANITASSVTTASDGDLLVFVAGIYEPAPGRTVTSPSGFTERYDAEPGSFAYVYFADAPQPSAGASGAKTALFSDIGQSVAGLVALKIGNVAPNAPIPVSPVGGVVVNRASDLLLTATFSDPDAGDSPSAWQWRYRVVGAGSWTDTGQIVNPTASFLIAGGTLSAADYEWQVKSWDAQGTAGTFSASSFFTAASTPTAPAITAPTHLSTISSSSASVTISAPSLDSLQVRTVADNAGTPDTGTVYFDSGEIIVPTQRTVLATFGTTGRVEHVQARIKKSGIWSAWAVASGAGTSSVKVTVSYTPPPAPSYNPIPFVNDTTGTITITASNATPTGGQPALTENRLWRRPGGDTGDGVRIATGVASGGTFDDHRVGDLEAVEYRWEAVGVNGVSTFGAWSDGSPLPSLLLESGSHLLTEAGDRLLLDV